MGTDRKVDEFDRWSKDRGLVARDVDRRRVARELFDLAGRSAVGDEHVDQLVKRYREGLMGAHGILQARRVAEELMSWQAEAPPEPEPQPESPRARSEQPRSQTGLESDSVPGELLPGVNLRKLARGALGAPRMPKDASKLLKQARGRGFSFQPDPGASEEVPAVEVPDKPVAVSERVERRSARPDRRIEEDSLAARARPRPSEPVASARASSRAPARASLQPIADPFESAPPPARAPAEESKADVRPSSRPISSAPPPVAPVSGAPEVPVQSERALAAQRFSSRPATSRRGVDVAREGSSRPPIRGGILDLDDEPKAFEKGRDRPASVRPEDAARLPEVEFSEEGTDHNRKQVDDHLVESVAPPPPPPRREASPVIQTAEVETSATKFIIGFVALALCGVLVYVFAARPVWLFGSGKSAVQGAYVSPHLEVALQFREPWLYARNLDQGGETNGWRRREASFFREGESFETAGTQLTIVVFSAPDRIAAEADALQLGAAQLVGGISQRECKPRTFGNLQGTECVALAALPGQSFGIVESYFPLDGKVVFARARIALVEYQRLLATPPAGAPPAFQPELLDKYAPAEDVVVSLQPVAAQPR